MCPNCENITVDVGLSCVKCNNFICSYCLFIYNLDLLIESLNILKCHKCSHGNNLKRKFDEI